MSIKTTWNDLPTSVRMNVANHYVPTLTVGTESVIEKISKECGIKWHRAKGYEEDSLLEFTDEQWTLFLLKWS